MVLFSIIRIPLIGFNIEETPAYWLEKGQKIKAEDTLKKIYKEKYEPFFIFPTK